MRNYLKAVLVALGLVLAGSGVAAASNGYTTGDVNMRAGPGTQYPRILVITRGTPVTIHGCLQGYSWCDVSVWRERGWVSSRYLDAFYRDRAYVPYRPTVQVPIISFGFGYWDRWYYNRPWYNTWRYDNVRPGNPGWDDDRPVRNDRPYRRDERPVRNDRPNRNDRVDRNDRVYVNPDRPPRIDDRQRGFLGDDRGYDRNDRAVDRNERGFDRSFGGDRGGRMGDCIWRNGACVN